MSRRLKLIEEKLKAIDGSEFQGLCDSFLYARDNEFISFNRIGSQIGKEKTIPGTPDTYFRLADGRLVFVEYTTQNDNLPNKIKDDINKCVDESKTGVPSEEITKIIYCFNSRLKSDVENEIYEFATSKNVRIELIGIDTLGLEINYKFHFLAKDFLDIPLDSGQILPIKTFIEEYNNKGGQISTPLDNPFLHREDELSEIGSSIISDDIIIISGFPGVGKTKLGLEVIKHFLDSNHGTKAFAISNKNYDILEDLKTHLVPVEKYIILVDDANRYLNSFSQLLGVFREFPHGNLKLIITVRNYALSDIEFVCSEYTYFTKNIVKLSDDQIIDIIKAEPFNIRHNQFQKRILEISDGNPRLAIMAARLAIKKQFAFFSHDLFEFYDDYFKTFINDKSIFSDFNLQKVLGLTSFFFSLDLKDKAFNEKIFAVFEIESHVFFEAVIELERSELVEIKYDCVRVSEQIMSNYFFYKVFIKDKLLSFELLMKYFFESHAGRFKDTVIPANNTFGYQEVISQINDCLTDYYNIVKEQKVNAFKFFDIFWMYRQNDLIEYFYLHISNLPEPQNPVYAIEDKTENNIWNVDKTLDYLSEFFRFKMFPNYKTALELSFEFCRKSPGYLTSLIKKIRELILFDEEDEMTHYNRQTELFEILYKGIANHQHHFIVAFFELAKTYLQYEYNNIKAGRHRSIISYTFIPNSDPSLRELRKKIWLTIDSIFQTYPSESTKFLESLSFNSSDKSPDLLNDDLTYLATIIEHNLNPEEFIHNYIVRKIIHRLNQLELPNRDYQRFQLVFDSKEYRWYCKIDWNYHKDKAGYEFENYDEYLSLKENDLRSSFLFNSQAEIAEFLSFVNKVIPVFKDNWNLSRSIDIIIKENIAHNESLGFYFIESLIEMNFDRIYSPFQTIDYCVNQSENTINRLWDILKSRDFTSRIQWQLVFFEQLAPEYLTEDIKNNLEETINSIDKYCFIHFEKLEKFLAIDKDIFEKTLLVIIGIIDSKEIVINLSSTLFSNYNHLFHHNFNLLSQAYFRQHQNEQHFDFNNEILKSLVFLNQDILISYLEYFYGEADTSYRNSSDRLSFLWELPEAYILAERAFNFLIEKTRYIGYSGHPINIFFKLLKPDQKDMAKEFLFFYIEKYNRVKNEMNAVFDVLQNYLNEFLEQALLLYLSFNNNLDSFKGISWSSNGGIHDSGVIYGELQGTKWNKILSIVQKYPMQLEVIPIVNYITKAISNEQRSSISEKKYWFRDPDH
jgi:hypothetical protein